jgi:undecaprenyl diphosphate synthase
MNLLRRFVRDDLAELHASGVRVRIIGERANLEPDIQSLIEESETLTRDNTAMTLVVAFNYGSRQEIVHAAQRLAREVASGVLDAENITAGDLTRHLYASDLPDPDLVIRTSGEQRLSNFLLWQAAYAELVFLPLHWPDFNRAALEQALDQFRQRERRFGGLRKAGQ